MSRARALALPFAVSVAICAVCVTGFVGCADVGEVKDPNNSYPWDLPPGFPPPSVPDDNPMTVAKVELGRHLFYDRRLSVDGEMSCATCHQQRLAFTDGRPRSVGATGELHPRGAMSLANVAYVSRLTWANPLLDRLEDQMLTPLFGEEPVEMGLAGREQVILAELAADPIYRPLFAAAFPDAAEPFTVLSVTRAIASFERTLISFETPYDRLLAGDGAAMDASAQRGMELFFSERLECFHCHAGFNFSDSVDHQGKPTAEFAFHNTGLYNIDGEGAYPSEDPGLSALTHESADMGRFRAPTLRNVALTAPYMHDGSVATLEDVLAHYAAGGRAESPLVSEFVPGFILSDAETTDLIAFLESLTDERFIADPRFADPWFADPRPGN